nr:protein kinase superfamily protein [Tanacetum cinerariifolium]
MGVLESRKNGKAIIVTIDDVFDEDIRLVARLQVYDPCSGDFNDIGFGEINGPFSVTSAVLRGKDWEFPLPPFGKGWSELRAGVEIQCQSGYRVYLGVFELTLLGAVMVHIAAGKLHCKIDKFVVPITADLYTTHTKTIVTEVNEKMGIDFKEFQDKLSTGLRPWQRSFEFWARAVDIYAGYKVFQLRVNFEKDAAKAETMWERQHEYAAEKVYSMCSDMGGFFLKIAQILGKPDLAPAAWVRRLVTLCDQAPATPSNMVQLVLENELGKSVDEMFERFEWDPIGSASIAQVHRARLKGDTNDVVVKVQHPGVQDLMMTDLRNLKAFALCVQKTDIKFDFFSVCKEMEKQIGYEFDFTREADAMDRIRTFLLKINRKTPVKVPRVIQNAVTRRVLMMEFIDGVPIMNLGDEIKKRGINPESKMAAAAKQNILKSLTLAYGQMILKSGFFHADPHPGNILICKGSEVALLDYGQVKDLPNSLRLGYANLVLAIADNDHTRASEGFRELGIDTKSLCSDEQAELFKLAQVMFDTKLPAGVKVLQPFSEDSSIKKVAVQAFPEELFSVLRTVQLLRGLSVGLGINYSCAEQWRPIAEEALYLAGRIKAEDMKSRERSKRGFFRRLLWL